MNDLKAYIASHPKAEDLDQAYMSVFERAIENDWFAETEGLAKGYLGAYPEGAVRQLAQVVATMARAQAGRYDEAWAIYRDLVKSLDKEDQKEFASNFADNLARSASGAGEYAVARKVYEAVLQQFGTDPNLREKIKDDLARLDRVGKPAPPGVARTLDGKVFRTAELKGKYVLLDFWATWCAPCVAELPNVQAAYAKYHDRGFEVVGISLDETAQPVVDFVQSRKIPWRQIHNATCGTDLVEAYGVNNIPATFLIDPDGKIVRLELRGAALDTALRGLLR
jgi:peroxiredoxin